MCASEEEIRQVLLQMKRVLTQSTVDPSRFVLVSREKNQRTMLDLELSYRDVGHQLLGLSVEDYCQGPCPDTAVNGLVWIFGKKVKGREIYIKLKMTGDHRAEVVRLLSFHDAMAPLRYPYGRSQTVGEELEHAQEG